MLDDSRRQNEEMSLMTSKVAKRYKLTESNVLGLTICQNGNFCGIILGVGLGRKIQQDWGLLVCRYFVFFFILLFRYLKFVSG